MLRRQPKDGRQIGARLPLGFGDAGADIGHGNAAALSVPVGRVGPVPAGEAATPSRHRGCSCGSPSGGFPALRGRRPRAWQRHAGGLGEHLRLCGLFEVVEPRPCLTHASTAYRKPWFLSTMTSAAPISAIRRSRSSRSRRCPHSRDRPCARGTASPSGSAAASPAAARRERDPGTWLCATQARSGRAMWTAEWIVNPAALTRKRFSPSRLPSVSTLTRLDAVTCSNRRP